MQHAEMHSGRCRFTKIQVLVGRNGNFDLSRGLKLQCDGAETSQSKRFDQFFSGRVIIIQLLLPKTSADFLLVYAHRVSPFARLCELCYHVIDQSSVSLFLQP